MDCLAPPTWAAMAVRIASADWTGIPARPRWWVAGACTEALGMAEYWARPPGSPCNGRRSDALDDHGHVCKFTRLLALRAPQRLTGGLPTSPSGARRSALRHHFQAMGSAPAGHGPNRMHPGHGHVLHVRCASSQISFRRRYFTFSHMSSCGPVLALSAPPIETWDGSCVRRRGDLAEASCKDEDTPIATVRFRECSVMRSAAM